MTEASGNPISSTKEVASDDLADALRIEWTRRGQMLAGLGFALFFVGMWRIDGVMAAMGLATGGVLLLSRITGKLNLRALSLDYCGSRRVEAGKGFSGRLNLRNGRAFLDGFWVDFGISVLGENAVMGRVLWLEAGGAVEAKSRVVLKERGRSDVQKGWVKSGFPLGLFLMEREIGIAAETGVYPVMKFPRELLLSGFRMEGVPSGRARNVGGFGEWRALREWRSGDAMRRIAWAASLRSAAGGGVMLVREDEPPGSQVESCLVVLHSYGTDGALIRPDRFERALSLLCGTLNALQGWGIQVKWKADFSGWEETSIASRAQFARTREQLISARRAAWTEAHDLADAFSRVGKSECLIVISDMPLANWEVLVPKLALPPVLVNISNYDGISRLEKGGTR